MIMQYAVIIPETNATNGYVMCTLGTSNAGILLLFRASGALVVNITFDLPRLSSVMRKNSTMAIRDSAISSFVLIANATLLKKRMLGDRSM